MNDQYQNTRTATEILQEEVYPNLDAAESNLLDDLNPKRQSSGYWLLTCPECGKNEAWYRQGGVISCNRLKKCGITISIWKYLCDKKGLSKKETFDSLCAAVGFVPDQSKSTFEHTPSSAFKKAVIFFAKENQQRMQQFAEDRGMTIDDIYARGYGYYPDTKSLTTFLSKTGVSLDACQDLGFIPYPHGSDKTNNANFMSGRLIGLWKQENETIGYWGYKLKVERNPQGQTLADKKYLFSSGIDKTIPYSFRNSLGNRPILCEGTFDSDSLTSLGFPAGATGQNRIITKQAAYIAKSGIRSCLFMTEGDIPSLTGAINSIVNCAEQGVICDVINTPINLGDADSIRSNNKSILFNELFKTATPAGEYLAQAWLFCLKETFSDAWSIKFYIEQNVVNLPTQISKPFYDLLTIWGFSDLEAQFTGKMIGGLSRFDKTNPNHMNLIKKLVD